MRDIEYNEGKFQQASRSLGALTGSSSWGWWDDGIFDVLKDINKNFEDAEKDIARLDKDRVIYFSHTSSQSTLNKIGEDLDILHKFADKAGETIHHLIDEPFYKDLDAFVDGMQNLTISAYTTKNRIGATTIQAVGYQGMGTIELPKEEVTIEDLLNGDNFYGEQIKQSYENWKLANPDQEINKEEFTMSSLHTRAFEYKSIQDAQQEKEFWVNIAAAVVIVGVGIFCPPAGIALGVGFGALEMSSAASGKDWISGRELDTGERAIRGSFALLDIIPGVKAFSSGTRALTAGTRIAQTGDGVLASGFRNTTVKIGDIVKIGKSEAAQRLRNARNAWNDGVNVAQNKITAGIEKASAGIGKAGERFQDVFQLPTKEALAVPGGGTVRLNAAARTTSNIDEVKGTFSRLGDVSLSGVGKQSGGIIEGASGATDDILSKSTCSLTELGDYLSNIDSKLAEAFRETGKWPEEIQIPKDSNVLTSDGKIDWSQVPNGGYVLDESGEAIKEVYAPQIGETIDRYGPNDGRYTSPIKESVPFSYDQRSLPYVEDISHYHRYEIVGDFNDIEKIVMNCDDKEFKESIEALVSRYYDGDYSKLVPYSGSAAPGFGAKGGAIQYEFPLPIEWLEKLGLLKEIR